jgi:predicted metalloprotease with PDZ domain
VRIAFVCVVLAGAARGNARLPQPLSFETSVPAPRDHPFRGTLRLSVDATDTRHKVLSAHETIPAQQPGPMVLLYPAWESASHAPTVALRRLAGLVIHAGRRRLDWRRDPVDVHAFLVHVPPGTTQLDVDFQYLAPTGRDGPLEMTPGLLQLAWQHVVLYPAGWFARNLVVEPHLRLPDGFHFGTALEVNSVSDSEVAFKPVSLEALIDAPVMAGRFSERRTLVTGERPVAAQYFADDAAALVGAAAQDAPWRAVIAEAAQLFGPAHFRRYDFLVALSDGLPGPGGVEHTASSEIVLPPDFLRTPSAHLPDVDVVAHEYAHAWNGCYRVPAELWTPTPNVPMRDSLLWIYEGQTELWARVLAARAGQRSVAETRDALAVDAAVAATRAGRAWKSLADSAHDPISMAGRPVVWRDWQRREDYYSEGVLLWLNVDAIVRRETGGRRGLDDFAHDFFAQRDGSSAIATYTVEDVYAALNRLAPFDWAGWFGQRLSAHDDRGLLDGLTADGWRLVFTPTPTALFTQLEAEDGAHNLTYSIGITVTAAGVLKSVAWNGPAFRAGLAPGARLLTVNGQPFRLDALDAAIAASSPTGIDVTADADGERAALRIDYRGGPRYPRLERLPNTSDGLTRLLAPRAQSAGP